MAGRGLVGVEASIAVSMAVGVFAVFALQQPFEVIVPAADVTGFIHGVIELLVEACLLDVGSPFSMANHGEGGPAVRTAVGEFAAFQDTGIAEDMLTVESTNLLLIELLKIR